MSTRNLLTIVSLAALVTGCTNNKRSYSVAVDNRCDKPVTVWLTQNYPASHPQWASPEDVAIMSPSANNPASRVVVLPGQTAYTGKVDAKFDSDTDAVLRIYVGERTYDEILAMSRGNPNRIDLVLAPGSSEIVLSRKDGMIVANVSETTVTPTRQ